MSLLRRISPSLAGHFVNRALVFALRHLAILISAYVEESGYCLQVQEDSGARYGHLPCSRLNSLSRPAFGKINILVLRFDTMSCPDCYKGFIHDYAQPVGRERILHGVRTYVAGTPDQQTSPSTIILITDVFGLNIVNNKLLADFLAAETGCQVLVPDMIPGGGVPASYLLPMESFAVVAAWWDIMGHLARIISILRLLPYTLPAVRGAERAFPDILAFVRAVRLDLPEDAKLGIAGYCWGGRQAAKLALEPAHDVSSRPLIDASYIAHPSSLKVPGDILESVRAFKVPLSMTLADQDFAMPKDKAIDLQVKMKQEFGTGDGKDEVPYEIVMYDGCRHGFACRGNRSDPHVDECANRASMQAVNWFERFLA
ncbi:hypothetical protein FDECE_12494 [Fusarium decemcellulare]|nr:hypothetical protein FDECE_12494 [Fusarium decemcellulare]